MESLRLLSDEDREGGLSSRDRDDDDDDDFAEESDDENSPSEDEDPAIADSGVRSGRKRSIAMALRSPPLPENTAATRRGSRSYPTRKQPARGKRIGGSAVAAATAEVEVEEEEEEENAGSTEGMDDDDEDNDEDFDDATDRGIRRRGTSHHVGGAGGKSRNNDKERKGGEEGDAKDYGGSDEGLSGTRGGATTRRPTRRRGSSFGSLSSSDGSSSSTIPAGGVLEAVSARTMMRAAAFLGEGGDPSPRRRGAGRLEKRSAPPEDNCDEEGGSMSSDTSPPSSPTSEEDDGADDDYRSSDPSSSSSSDWAGGGKMGKGQSCSRGIRAKKKGLRRLSAVRIPPRRGARSSERVRKKRLEEEKEASASAAASTTSTRDDSEDHDDRNETESDSGSINVLFTPSGRPSRRAAVQTLERLGRLAEEKAATASSEEDLEKEEGEDRRVGGERDAEDAVGEELSAPLRKRRKKGMAMIKNNREEKEEEEYVYDGEDGDGEEEGEDEDEYQDGGVRGGSSWEEDGEDDDDDDAEVVRSGRVRSRTERARAREQERSAALAKGKGDDNDDEDGMSFATADTSSDNREDGERSPPKPPLSLKKLRRSAGADNDSDNGADGDEDNEILPTPSRGRPRPHTPTAPLGSGMAPAWNPYQCPVCPSTVDGVTHEPLPLTHVCYVAPDGRNRHCFALKTLFRISLMNEQSNRDENGKLTLLQPPHFRGPMDDDLIDQIRSRFGRNATVVEESALYKKFLEDKGRLARLSLVFDTGSSDEEDGGGRGGFRDRFQNYLSQVMGSADIYCCPLCYAETDRRMVGSHNSDDDDSDSDSERVVKDDSGKGDLCNFHHDPMTILGSLDNDEFKEAAEWCFRRVAEVKRHLKDVHRADTSNLDGNDLYRRFQVRGEGP